MAHYARISKETNLVIEVIVVPNNKCQSPTIEKRMINVALPLSGKEDMQIRDVTVMVDDEAKGVEFLNKLYNNPTDVYFRQTSYHGNIRKNFAGIGYAFNEKLDGFIAPMPTSPMLIKNEKEELVEDIGEWVLNEQTCRWEWVSASTNTQSMFRRAANAIVELPSKIVNIVLPKKQETMTEKYTGSYFKFLFKDSKNWIAVAMALAIYLYVAIDSKFALGSYFFLFPLALVVLMTLRTYTERKNGKTS